MNFDYFYNCLNEQQLYIEELKIIYKLCPSWPNRIEFIRACERYARTYYRFLDELMRYAPIDTAFEYVKDYKHPFYNGSEQTRY